MYTTGPAFVIALVIYGILGLRYSADNVNSEMVTATLAAIEGNFNMNILLLLPAVVVIFQAIKKAPSIPTLLASSLTTIVLGMLCGAYMAGTLGVSTVEYLPYAFFCWLWPVIAIICGFTGKFLWKTGEIPSNRTYRPVDEAAPVQAAK